MRSKILRTANLANERILGELRTRPTGFFATLFLLGLGLLLFDRVYQALGMLLVAFSCFSLFIAPDKILIQFSEDYLVLHNTLDTEECKLIYWDEMICWNYVKRSKYDYLIVELIDGTTEKIECFNRIKVENYMKVYAGGKRKKSMRGSRT